MDTSSPGVLLLERIAVEHEFSGANKLEVYNFNQANLSVRLDILVTIDAHFSEKVGTISFLRSPPMPAGMPRFRARLWVH